MRCMQVLLAMGDGSPQIGGSGGRPDHTAILTAGRLRGPSWRIGRVFQWRRQVRTTLPFFHRQYLRVCCREYGSCAIQGHTTVRQPGAEIWALGRQGHRGEEA